MKETYFELKAGQHGLLDDGRSYTILSIPSIIMCSNGTLARGRLQLNIEDDFYELTIEEFVDHVASVRDLKVREVKSKKQAQKYCGENCREQKGWISVDNELPKQAMNCLVHLKHAYSSTDGYHETKMVLFNGTDFDVDSKFYRVTHWMLLPENPKN